MAASTDRGNNAPGAKSDLADEWTIRAKKLPLANHASDWHRQQCNLRWHLDSSAQVASLVALCRGACTRAMHAGARPPPARVPSE